MIAIGLLVVGLIGAAVMIFKVKTPEGTIVLKVNVPNAEVLVDGSHITVSWADGGRQAEIHVPPGSRKIELQKDGFKAFGETVSIAAGGHELLAATLDPLTKLAGDSPSPGREPRDSSTLGTPPLAIAPFDAKQAKAHQAAWAKHLGTKVETINSVGMRLTLIPPGEFLMGSTPEQNAVGRKLGEDDKLTPTDGAWARLKEKGPQQHRVAITRPYWLGMTEVTIGQFRKFVEAAKYVTQAEQFGFGNSGAMKADEKTTPEMKKMTWRTPGYAVTDDSPVTQVTWNDCIMFCNWLSDQEKLQPCYRQDSKDGWVLLPSGTGYRLPTEAEWEYACRAGTTTQFSFGDDADKLEIYGWFGKNAGGRAHAVGSKVANAFGLFDMHGNLWEWCQDFHAGDYYSKSSPNNPTGPSSGSSRVIRGGYWASSPVTCSSAIRFSDPPGRRLNDHGLRVVRVSVNAVPPPAVATSTTSPPNVPVTSGGGQPNQPWNTPAFQAWMKSVAALPAEKQVEAVSKKLMELNPGFDGKTTPRIDNGAVTILMFSTDNVTDISPVRALAGLKTLFCNGISRGKSRLSDLSPLRGMPLTNLACSDTQVSDLSPLKGMPLTDLNCLMTPVSDLSPLQGMKLKVLFLPYSRVSDLSPLRGMLLENLNCDTTLISDLSPLQGMPLNILVCNGTPVSDLSPLEMVPLTTLMITGTKVSDLSPLHGTNLTEIRFTPSNITRGLDVIRQMKSLKTIRLRPGGETNAWPPVEFWKKYDAGEFGKPNAPAKLAYLDPAFQQWIKATQALPADQQIEAVRKKLMELNPGFDGKVQESVLTGPPKVENGVVTQIGFVTDNVSDISPVRALARLALLNCRGSLGRKGMLSDLSPLEGLRLTSLVCNDTRVSDVTPLRGMTLNSLICLNTQVSDLSPLRGMPISHLHVNGSKIPGAALAEFPGLISVNLDAGQLRTLPVLNEITTIILENGDDQSLAILGSLKLPNLTRIYLQGTKQKNTGAGREALQKAYPACAIN